jgi:TolB-like protein
MIEGRVATVFLSYAHQDEGRAKSLAKGLERHGHSVWWDRHIRGGSRFSGAIEHALTKADAVVVLWSKSSVQSTWVCDEAAEGRDTGRLVPVLLDDSRPPIGFRQYHTIDLSGWSGRGTPPKFSDLTYAISETAEQTSAASPTIETPVIPKRSPRLAFVALAIAAIVAIAAAALFLYPRTSAEAIEPTIAVLPFADLSPQRDKGYLGDGIADAILTMLAREPGLSVIGRSSAAQFRDRPDDLRRMRRAFGVTHILEGSTQAIGDRLRMSVRLIDASTGKDMWADDYRRDMNNIFEVQDEIAAAVATQLKGSIARGLPGAQRTAVDTYSLYLAARARMRERQPQPLREALDLARQVVAADPNYGPGHALYADAITALADTAYGQIPAQTALRLASAHARKAIDIAPTSADGYGSLGGAWSQIDGSRAIAPLQKAIQMDPSRAELRMWLGAAQNDVGRNVDAERNYRLAVEVDPLLRPAVWRLVVVYAASREYDRAEAVAAAYFRRGGSKAWAKLLRGEIAEYRGDLATAVRYYRAAVREHPESRLPATRLAATYSELGLYELARPLVQQEKPLLRALLTRSPDATALARSAPESIWYGDDFEWAVEYLASARGQPSILKLYDMPTALRSRVCRLPLAAIQIVIALRSAGRFDEAARLLACARRTVAAHREGPYRTEFLPQGTLHIASAQLAALDGNQSAVFGELKRAADAGFRTPAGRGLDYFPAFDQLRSAPEYGALDRRFRQLTLAERQKLLTGKT